MALGAGLTKNNVVAPKLKKALKNDRVVGLRAGLKTKTKYLKSLQFKKNVLLYKVAAGKAALKKLYPSNATPNIVNATGAFYNGTNTARSAVKNNPSAQLNNSARNVSKDNISGTIWEELSNKNNALNIQMNRENNEFNALQAELQRNWEAHMSNTAHQREVADLQAAGLNPILSAGGTGATTPSGSSASASNFVGADAKFIDALAQLAAVSMSSNAQITSASLNSAAVERAAAMNSSATMYASDNSARAAQYSADASAAASRYGADRSASASRYGSNTMSDAYRYGATANALASAINGIAHVVPMLF